MLDQQTNDLAAQPPHGWLDRLQDAWQWLMASALFAVTLLALLFVRQLDAPGAPITLFWISLAVGLLTSALHLPRVVRSFPPRWRMLPYLAAIGFFILLGTTLHSVTTAWEKTPEGEVEAKSRNGAREAEQAEELQRQQTEADLAEAQDVHEQLGAKAKQLEACFSTFGRRLPALEKAIKEAVHNPRAFEHIETVAIVPDSDGKNVAMRFRAENGFGAIRTALVKAAVIPENCEIVSIGEPEAL